MQNREHTMRTLVLHPTETCQWYALVNEAQVTANLMLREDIESYLVFLLMRFSQGTKLVESVIALDFLHGLHAGRSHKIELLRDVGDKSLLFSGLFEDVAKHRQVSLDYFIGIGRSAYFSLCKLYEAKTASLYYELSQQFVPMQHVLQAIRKCN